jgi:hypothetical protein
MQDDNAYPTGGCLCSGVRYQVRGRMTEIWACHCSQCRRTTGNFFASSNADRADLQLVVDDTLRWYRSSDTAERGFCNRCGSNLFWRRTAPDDQTISITAGSIDPPTLLRLAAHIFVADKSDFYEIADELPQYAAGPT